MSAHLILTFIIYLIAAIGSLAFSSLTFALRDLSRVRLAEFLERVGRDRYLERTTRHRADLIFLTAVGRLIFNLIIVLSVLRIFSQWERGELWRLGFTALAAGLTMTLFSVAIPSAIATHIGDSLVGAAAPFLSLLRTLALPATKLMHLVDELVRRATGQSNEPEPEHLEQEILSVVEEGAKDGIVDEQEREMIVSVIQFRDTTVGQIMTSRPEIVGIEMGASLDEIRHAVEQSGNSRLPVYDGTLDHITGILYARDLLQYLGQPLDTFNIKSAMRPALYVPETKPLRDLLRDFRSQKVHIAIVLDEYGGTAGLATIEDILEELVGDISDEHEPIEPAMFKRLSDGAAEADARMYIGDFNRLMGLELPEDAGYETLGGFVSTTLGKIPESGVKFEAAGATFTVLDAEPQKVNRVRIEVTPEPAEPVATATVS